jgi:hypothetical protein
MRVGRGLPAFAAKIKFTGPKPEMYPALKTTLLGMIYCDKHKPIGYVSEGLTGPSPAGWRVGQRVRRDQEGEVGA